MNAVKVTFPDGHIIFIHPYYNGLARRDYLCNICNTVIYAGKIYWLLKGGLVDQKIVYWHVCNNHVEA